MPQKPSLAALRTQLKSLYRKKETAEKRLLKARTEINTLSNTIADLNSKLQQVQSQINQLK